MSTSTLREYAASAAFTLVLLAYIAYGVYGIYLEHALARFRLGERPPKHRRWDPALYAPGAARWIVRDRRWHRLRYGVWIGAIALGNVLYLVIRP
jgi:hypothetical protein